jgi:hypothetical protein
VTPSVVALALLLVVMALLGVVSSLSVAPAGGPPAPRATAPLSFPQNGSSGGDPPAAAVGLCPSGGPVILGVEWNCVAVLNLTELTLILATIGIVAYVFKDADRAELPGESADVPVTAAEWEEYRKARNLGLPYRLTPPPDPPGTAGGDEER